MARLKELYKSKIASAMKEKYRYSSSMASPRLQKIVVSMGVGKAIADKKFMELAVKDMTTITGQKPLVCLAKKSVSNFKLREGRLIGTKVTLRGDRMWAFLDRLMNIVLPRVRDFRGVSAEAFDGRGNYTLGLREQIIFPEIEYDKVDKVRGMEITIVTTAPSDEQAAALLQMLGMPFRKD